MGLPIPPVLQRPRVKHGDKPVPALDAGSQKSRQYRAFAKEQAVSAIAKEQAVSSIRKITGGIGHPKRKLRFLRKA